MIECQSKEALAVSQEMLLHVSAIHRDATRVLLSSSLLSEDMWHVCSSAATLKHCRRMRRLCSTTA